MVGSDIRLRKQPTFRNATRTVSTGYDVWGTSAENFILKLRHYPDLVLVSASDWLNGISALFPQIPFIRKPLVEYFQSHEFQILQAKISRILKSKILNIYLACKFKVSIEWKISRSRNMFDFNIFLALLFPFCFIQSKAYWCFHSISDRCSKCQRGVSIRSQFERGFET